MHKHLERQLRKLALAEGSLPDSSSWRQLLDRISRTYDDADSERYTLERNISLSSTEMRELHARLAAERDRFRAIFESVALGIWRIDLQGRVLDVNPALERFLGYAARELVGRYVWEFVSAEGQDVIRARFSLDPTQRVDQRELARRYVRKDGVQVDARVSVSMVRDDAGTPQFSIHVAEDVTEQRRLEIELRHAQKLETVGRLAAGIAHEINTPIQFVGDNTQFAQEAFEAITRIYTWLREASAAVLSPELKQRFTELEDEGDIPFLLERLPSALAATQDGATRVATIVRAMKSFAHPERGSGKVNADLNQALESTITVARNELKYVADVELRLGDIPSVPCFIGDLNQVFLNLLVNAAHAIGDTIASGRCERGTIVVKTHRDGDDVVVSVTDSGTGIPAQIAPQIFDPFFTTKEVGRGTGQGLAISRSVVVDKHHGSLTFETELGRGTTFLIRLPLGERIELTP